MAIPKFLYKYQPLTIESLTNLKNRQIWFSKPKRFNDPYDCAVRVLKDEINDEEMEKILQQAKTEMPNIKTFDQYKNASNESKKSFNKRTLETISNLSETQKTKMLNERGVACFSELKDNVLMWSHYAQGHKGFCLEFDISFELFRKAFPVQYSKMIPKIRPASIILEDSEPLMPMITTKADYWAYEKEWRIFHVEGDRPYGYGVNCLTGVYFGTMMEFSHKEIIFMILHGSPTKFYEMRKSEDEFRLSCEPVEYTPYHYK
jgi:hypothetical protein